MAGEVRMRNVRRVIGGGTLVKITPLVPFGRKTCPECDPYPCPGPRKKRRRRKPK